jgi:PAS domain-containing protein
MSFTSDAAATEQVGFSQTDRLQRLRQVSLSLARAATIADVVDTILTEGMMALGANAGAVYRLDASTQEVYAIRVVGFPEETVRPYARHALSLSTPMTEAIRSGMPLYIETHSERMVRFPSTRQVSGEVPVGAVAVFPLQADDMVFGALGLSFAGDRMFSADDRIFSETIAHLCALSFARAIQLDYTEQALASLKRAEARHAWDRSILESAQVAIIARDLEGRFTLWNRGAEQLYGYTAAEALGV